MIRRVRAKLSGLWKVLRSEYFLVITPRGITSITPVDDEKFQYMTKVANALSKKKDGS